MSTPKYISSSRFRAELLLNAIFLFALVILIVNDHYWKAVYGNILTGKLSDFAGLILLHLDLCTKYHEACLPEHLLKVILKGKLHPLLTPFNLQRFFL